MMRQRVRITKDLPELRLVKRKLGPFAVGDESELWTWDAAVLSRQGVAEIIQAPTAAEVRKLIMAEERSLELSTLSPDFYNLVAHSAAILSSEGKREEANELRALTFSLIESRLPKLFKLALSPGNIAGLPLEEQFFVNGVTEVVESWTKSLSKLFEAEEEVGKNEVGGSVRHVAGDDADIQKSGVSEAELHAGGTAT